MPRFFFDVHHSSWNRDDTGSNCTDINHAIRLVKQTLPDMVVEHLPEAGDRYAMTVLVRDEGGTPVYTGALTFTGLLLNSKDQDPDEKAC